MRRERIIQASQEVREALHAAGIRELLREARTAHPSGDGKRTADILTAYSEFMRHYHGFGEEERGLVAMLGLAPLADSAFWSSLIEGGQAVDRKVLSDLEVDAYNVMFVMPKLRELLARHTDKGELIVTDGRGKERPIKCLRILVAGKERSLTDPGIIIAVIRAIDKLYKALALLSGPRSVSLAIGSIDSGSAKAFDFFGASAIIDEMHALLVGIWDKIKYSPIENFRSQIEISMVALGFVARAKRARAQNIVSEEDVQRTTRIVASSIEMLFRSGGYTEEMDKPREVKASTLLTSSGYALHFKDSGENIDIGPAGEAQPLDHSAWPAGHSITGPGPSIAGILSNMREEAAIVPEEES